MSLHCGIAACKGHSDLANLFSQLLSKEYSFECTLHALPDELVGSGAPLLSPDACTVALDYRTDPSSLAILIAPTGLVTPFGYRIAGESKGGVIVVSGTAVNCQNYARLLRHEIGHFFGLPEHLDCVMSPYRSEEAAYCSACRSELQSAGITWRNSTASPRPDTGTPT